MVNRGADGGAEDGLGLNGSEVGDLGAVEAVDRARDGERFGLLAHDNLWVSDATKSLASFGMERPSTSWAFGPSAT